MKTKYEIVKFKDGTYAVRETILGSLIRADSYRYVSTNNYSYRWSKTSEFFPHCVCDTFDRAEHILNAITDVGEPV